MDRKGEIYLIIEYNIVIANCIMLWQSTPRSNIHCCPGCKPGLHVQPITNLHHVIGISAAVTIRITICFIDCGDGHWVQIDLVTAGMVGTRGGDRRHSSTFAVVVIRPSQLRRNLVTVVLG